MKKHYNNSGKWKLQVEKCAKKDITCYSKTTCTIGHDTTDKESQGKDCFVEQDLYSSNNTSFSP